LQQIDNDVWPKVFINILIGIFLVPAQAPDINKTIIVDGLTRQYLLHLPPGYIIADNFLSFLAFTAVAAGIDQLPSYDIPQYSR
jgi:hypothetical protein